MSRLIRVLAGIALLGLAVALPARGHDPIFGLGPHTIYQGGYEIHVGALRERAGDERETELEAHLAYGLTGDWLVGAEVPFRDVIEDSGRATGSGDVGLFTKYRFWRQDRPGVQRSTALFAKASLPTGDETTDPALGSGATSGVLGLAFGREARTWYHWEAIRYRRSGRDDAGRRPGDRVLVDLAAAYRPYPSGYYAPDTLFTLEVNTEITDRADHDGRELADTGGTEAFLAPGIWWTYRNFAVQTGVQLPLHDDLNGDQAATDYRGQLTFEWHY